MSVYVDILPDGCDSCVCNDDYWRCGISGESISHDGRREDCPLKEIVRCKDCKWRELHLCMNKDAPAFYMEVNADDFCSYGKRKLKNPDNSLVTEESKDCKKQKSMSVLIKNMEMPKCCGECYLCHTQNFRTWCCPTGREDIYYDSIPEWCPLEEQKSKLNDDLISRQAAIEEIALHDCTNGTEPYFSGHEVIDILKCVPPVEPKPVCEDAISRSDTLKQLCAECDVKCEDGADKEAYCTEYALVKGMPPVEPKRLPQPHKCVVYRDGECRYPIEACSECPKHEGMRAVLAERPKGEWNPCTDPPKDRRNVFLARGTNDFKSCCIGHYEQGMGWYEDRNFFAKPIYDCKYWCDIPDLPDMGDNQFDMRGDK